MIEYVNYPSRLYQWIVCLPRFVTIMDQKHQISTAQVPPGTSLPRRKHGSGHLAHQGGKLERAAGGSWAEETAIRLIFIAR